MLVVQQVVDLFDLDNTYTTHPPQLIGVIEFGLYHADTMIVISKCIDSFNMSSIPSANDLRTESTRLHALAMTALKW